MWTQILARSPRPTRRHERGDQAPFESRRYDAVAAAGAALVSVVIYFVFSRAATVLAKLGDVGTLVMVRMMAFILLCIGIQIVWTGWAELNGIPH